MSGMSLSLAQMALEDDLPVAKLLDSDKKTPVDSKNESTLLEHLTNMSPSFEQIYKNPSDCCFGAQRVVNFLAGLLPSEDIQMWCDQP